MYSIDYIKDGAKRRHDFRHLLVYPSLVDSHERVLFETIYQDLFNGINFASIQLQDCKAIL